MLSPHPFSSSGITNKDALTNYIQTYLGGTITTADYPAGSEGRILQNAQLIPEPGALGLLGLGLAGLAATRKRKQ